MLALRITGVLTLSSAESWHQIGHCEHSHLLRTAICSCTPGARCGHELAWWNFELTGRSSVGQQTLAAKDRIYRRTTQFCVGICFSFLFLFVCLFASSSERAAYGIPSYLVPERRLLSKSTTFGYALSLPPARSPECGLMGKQTDLI